MKKSTHSVKNFFRIMLPSVLKHNKLVLPKLFFQEFDHELSKVITLNVPAGGTWKVNLEKLDGSLILCDGLQKFMSHHNIVSGHLLLFKYKGNSEFNVNVFDFTASEIQSSSGISGTPRHNKEIVVFESEEESEEKDNEDDDYSASIETTSRKLRSSRRVASLERLNQASKRRKRGVTPINLGDQCGRRSDIVEPGSCNGLNQEASSRKCVSGDKSSSRNESNGQKSTAHERRERALEAANSYKSDNPSFLVPIKSYNIHNAHIVHVPAKYSKDYMPLCPKSVNLQDSDNVNWSTRCIERGGKVTSLSKGWIDFARAKELNVGDVCVFELINANPVALKVTIFRA